MAGSYYNSILRINNQTGTSYTLSIADFNSDTITIMDNASANTVTVPPSVFPIGAQLLVAQEGLGQTSFVAGAGVTINAIGLSISSRYKTVILIQVALNEWDAYGTLDAASSYTSRTTAFATATAITDTTILNALNTFDLGLISNGLDTKMKAIYPMVGGTSTTHKYNFMDARDVDAAFRLTFNGGVTHSSTGVLPSGINGYANTHINAGTSLTINSVHYSFYSRTNTSGVFVELGNLFVAYSNHIRIAANVTIDVPASVVVPFTTTTDSRGFWMGNKTSSTYRSAIRNGVTENFDNTNISGALNPLDMFLLCRNDNGTAAYFTNRECAFSSFGSGLSDTEATTFYTLVQNMQTTLARNV